MFCSRCGRSLFDVRGCSATALEYPLSGRAALNVAVAGSIVLYDRHAKAVRS